MPHAGHVWPWGADCVASLAVAMPRATHGPRRGPLSRVTPPRRAGRASYMDQVPFADAHADFSAEMEEAGTPYSQ